MNQQISVILLCGGQGVRMQTVTPKQFLSIQGKLIAHYSFDLFKSMPEVAEIVIVCEESFRHLFPKDLCTIPVSFAPPGARRQDSVYNGLQALQTKASFVCIHDSARPCINPSLVQRVIHAAIEHGAATAGMPLKFTLKEHDGQQFVKQTPDRSKYWEIQTPQIIRKEVLMNGFDYVQKNNLDVTDDVSLAELMGHPVKLVEGDYTNIKVTTPDDLQLIDYLFSK